ncbi:hypothetical protein K435DRAFT_940181 [Dendrothele bispora CBS 962.96]|uniref:Uncharacterized protein n=1 Tax=Dendrothele bispora (strain CBS 962.96) TaxID=1314807 RepID=A0A4S8MAE6_DENBC|nr:hypothetical protein K435DRAFT_940181 [Dendrothele bispora CBS 962.96]
MWTVVPMPKSRLILRSNLVDPPLPSMINVETMGSYEALLRPRLELTYNDVKADEKPNGENPKLELEWKLESSFETKRGRRTRQSERTVPFGVGAGLNIRQPNLVRQREGPGSMQTEQNRDPKFLPRQALVQHVCKHSMPQRRVTLMILKASTNARSKPQMDQSLDASKAPRS